MYFFNSFIVVTFYFIIFPPSAIYR